MEEINVRIEGLRRREEQAKGDDISCIQKTNRTNENPQNSESKQVKSI